MINAPCMHGPQKKSGPIKVSEIPLNPPRKNDKEEKSTRGLYLRHVFGRE